MPLDFHFLFFSGAWLFLSFPLVLLFWSRKKSQKENLLSLLIHPSSIKRVVKSPDSFQITAQLICTLFGLAFLIFAFMQPVGNPRYVGSDAFESRGVSPHEWMFLVDNSASMAVEDSRSGQRRLAVAKEVVNALIPKLPPGPISLYSFSNSLQEWVPSTWDTLFVRMLLDNIPILYGSEGGTDLSQAFYGVFRRISQEPKELHKTVILLSDGGDTAYEVANEATKEERAAVILESLSERERWNLQVIVIAIGSEEGGEVPEVLYEGESVRSSVDLSLLFKVAKSGGGRLFPLGTESATLFSEKVASWIQKNLPKDGSGGSINTPGKLTFTHYFRYPLFAGILCLILAFLLKFPLRFFVLIFTLMLPWPLQAEESVKEVAEANLWAHLGRYDQAKEIYTNVFDQVELPWQRALLIYNLSTVRLFEQKFEDAEMAFEQLSLQDDLSPALLPVLHQNLALSQLSQVEKFRRKDARAFLSSTQILSQAEENLEQALRFWCELQAIQGLNECKYPLNWSLAVQWLKKEQKLARIARQKAFIDRLSERKKIKEKLRLVGDIMDYVGNHQIQGMHEWLNSLNIDSVDSLKVVFEQFPVPSPYEEILEDLRLNLWVYEQNGISAPSFSGLMQQAEKFESLLDQEERPEVKFWKEWVYESIGEDSPVYLRGLLWSLNAMDQKKYFTEEFLLPEKTLSLAFGVQLMLFDLTSMSRKGFAPFNYLEKGQKWVEVVALSFVQEVIDLQKNLFEQERSTCDPDRWEQILKFYEEGLKRSIFAQQFIREKNLAEALDEQNETLIFWERALQLLTELSPSEQTMEQTERRALVQSLVEMEQEDRKVPVQKSKGMEESLW